MSGWDEDLPRFWGIGSLPIVPPHAPDRAAEIWLMFIGGTMLLATLGMAAYIYIGLEMPEAIWSVLPMLIVPAGFAWGAKAARSKRRKAEREVASYMETLARVADRD